MNESSRMRFEFKIDFKLVRHIATKKKAPLSQSRLCQSLILAHQLQALIHDGKIAKTHQACEWLNISPSRLSQILCLLLLSPRIQEEIMHSEVEELGGIIEEDAREIAVKIDWEEQLREWEKLQLITRKDANHADTKIE